MNTDSRTLNSNNRLFHHDVRVYINQTDAGGIVHYASFLIFFEEARTELLRTIGFTLPELLREHNLVFCIKNVNLDFKRAAALDDYLCVRSTVKDITRCTIAIDQEIYKKDDVRPLASGVTTLAVLDAMSCRPMAIPKPLEIALRGENLRIPQSA